MCYYLFVLSDYKDTAKRQFSAFVIGGASDPRVLLVQFSANCSSNHSFGVTVIPSYKKTQEKQSEQDQSRTTLYPGSDFHWGKKTFKTEKRRRQLLWSFFLMLLFRRGRMGLSYESMKTIIMCEFLGSNPFRPPYVRPHRRRLAAFLGCSLYLPSSYWPTKHTCKNISVSPEHHQQQTS